MIRFFTFVTWVFSLSINAQILEFEYWNGSDSNSNHIFVANPAAVQLEKKTVGGGGAMQKTNEVDVDTASGDRGQRRQSFNQTEQIIGVGGLMPFGAGMYLGGNIQQNSKKLKTSYSIADNSPITETHTNRYLALQFGFEVVKGIRLGALFRSMWTSADIVGTFWADEEDGRVKYDGTASGNGFGLLLGTNRGGFAIAYLAPMRGKANILGESVIISEHGVFAIENHFSAGKWLRFGFGGRYYMQAKGSNGNNWQDERNEVVEVDEKSIFLRGLYHEEEVFAAAAGFELDLSGPWVLNGTYRHTYGFALVPFLGADVGNTPVNRNLVQAAIGQRSFKTFWQLGAGLGKAQKKWEGDEGSADFDSEVMQIFINVTM